MQIYDKILGDSDKKTYFYNNKSTPLSNAQFVSQIYNDVRDNPNEKNIF